MRDRTVLATLRVAAALVPGTIALLTLVWLAFATSSSEPPSALTWALGKTALIFIALSALGCLAVGGMRGLQGVASGLAWVISFVGAWGIFTGWGWWAVLSAVVFLCLSIVTPTLAVTAALDRWRLPS